MDIAGVVTERPLSQYEEGCESSGCFPLKGSVLGGRNLGHQRRVAGNASLS